MALFDRQQGGTLSTDTYQVPSGSKRRYQFYDNKGIAKIVSVEFESWNVGMYRRTRNRLYNKQKTDYDQYISQQYSSFHSTLILSNTDSQPPHDII